MLAPPRGVERVVRAGIGMPGIRPGRDGGGTGTASGTGGGAGGDSTEGEAAGSAGGVVSLAVAAPGAPCRAVSGSSISSTCAAISGGTTGAGGSNTSPMRTRCNRADATGA